MILAEKLVELRKQAGWSQEELADRLGVTRQSVSKWESAQSVPDLDRILKLARLFGVSTDCLLRDELTLSETELPAADDGGGTVRCVSMEEACEFLAVKALTARRIALAAFLCILSPVCLIVLGVAGELGRIPLSEDAACGLGMIVLLVLVAAAVALFVTCGMKTEKFQYLERELIKTAYGVTGMVRQRQEQYRPIYTKYNVIGVCCCILAVMPLFTGLFFPEDALRYAALTGLLLALVGVGVYFFIVAGVNWASMQKLLEEGEYSRAVKRASRTRSVVSSVYWLLATAIYLAWSFTTNGWERTWIIWPIAGVLFAALMVVCNALGGREDG